MGTHYTLVNLTKKEVVNFHKLPVSKRREIAGNPAGAAIVSWYLLENSGDKIAFFGGETESPFAGISYTDICGFPDKTDEMVDALIGQGILTDCGISYRDEDDPDIFLRDIRNAWMPPELLIPRKQDAETGPHD